MQKWEYKVESMTMADRGSARKQEPELNDRRTGLNTLGSQGWELISYESIPMYGSFSSKLKGYAYLLFMKRAID